MLLLLLHLQQVCMKVVLVKNYNPVPEKYYSAIYSKSSNTWFDSMPLTPAQPASLGAWKEQLIPAANKVAASFKRCHYLNGEDEFLNDTLESDHPKKNDIIIHCHVHVFHFVLRQHIRVLD